MLEFGVLASECDQQLVDETSFHTTSPSLPVKQLPYLRELDLRCYMNRPEFNLLHQLDLPTLRKLRFQGNGSTNKVLQEMLQPCPRVQTLHLHCNYDNNPDFSMSLNTTWKQAADLEVMNHTAVLKRPNMTGC